MSECPKCKSNNSPEATECHQCGIIFARYEQFQAKQAKEKEHKKKQPLKKCPVCEKEISKNAAKCPHCGEPNSVTSKVSSVIAARTKEYQALEDKPSPFFLYGLGGIVLMLVLSLFSQCTSPEKSISDSPTVTKVETRKSKIEICFSPFNGTHRGLERMIKQNMNDPGSYDHVKTTYWDRDDHLIVTTVFRGKNAFGALMKNSISVKTDLVCNVTEVISQNP